MGEIEIRKTPAAARNSSVELLRIVAMLMIVLSHVCVHSGIDRGSMPLSLNRIFIRWGSLGNLGVDIFVMISGYFLCTKKNPTTSLGKLLVQVWFYSVGLFIVCWLGFGYSYAKKDLLEVFLPTIFSEYWFFTAYFVLLMISPYLNAFLSQGNREGLQKLLFVLVLLWVLIPTFTRQGMYGAEIPQFILFYMIGAYFRMHPDNCFQHKRIRMLVTLCSFGLLFSSTVIFEVIGTRISFFVNQDALLYERRSLLVVGCAVGLFTNAIYAKPFTNRFVNEVAACTFGVYLIHDNPAVRKILWRQLLPNAQFLDSPFLILRILGSAAVVFVCAAGIEYLRQKTVAKPMLNIYEKAKDLVLRGAKVCWTGIAAKMQTHAQK